MSAFYQDNHDTIYCQDFRKNDLPDEVVQMVCTSPPYWGLRKYSGEQELIWGDNCEHQWGDTIPNPMLKSGKHGPASILTKTADEQHAVRKESNQGSFCSLCGAWKGAYGLEPTPEMYIEHTIEILREIRRVLRKDGVVFWNIGDSYAGSGKYADPKYGAGRDDQPKGFKGDKVIKPKDLCLIPFRVAIAAQQDGWYVRSVIIWSKPNPMPSSCTDRPTTSHEYILMLTKSARYYFDADAVREKPSIPFNPKHINIKRDWSEFSPIETHQKTGNPIQNTNPQAPEAGRNIRSVWEFPTQPYPKAHFAVFPEKLPEICIKAASPEVGCCSKCGAPWERITEYNYEQLRKRGKWVERAEDKRGMARSEQFFKFGLCRKNVETLGWQPSCQCCRKCDIIGLSTNERKVAHATQRPRTGEGLEAGVEQEAVEEQPRAPQEEQGEATKVSEGMQEMREGLYRQGRRRILQSDLLNEMDVGEQTREPFSTNEEGEQVSIQMETGEGSEASSVSDGGTSGETATTKRVSSPHQWRQERQPDTEPCCSNETKPCSKPYKSSKKHKLEPYDKVPSIVLDPFSGAGTTLWVAKKLNRKAIGYEISEEYCKLATERIRQQALL